MNKSSTHINASFATLQMTTRVSSRSRLSLCPIFKPQSRRPRRSRASRHNRRRLRNRKSQSNQRPREGDQEAECPHRNTNLFAKNQSTSPERKSRRKKVLTTLLSIWFLKLDSLCCILFPTVYQHRRLQLSNSPQQSLLVFVFDWQSPKCFKQFCF